jgi:hypothetical protein
MNDYGAIHPMRDELLYRQQLGRIDESKLSPLRRQELIVGDTRTCTTGSDRGSG